MQWNKAEQDFFAQTVIGAAYCSDMIEWYISNLDDDHRYKVIVMARNELVRVSAVNQIQKSYIPRILKDEGQSAAVWIAAIKRLNDTQDALYLESVLERTEHTEIVKECAKKIARSNIIYKIICSKKIAFANKKRVVLALNNDDVLVSIVLNKFLDKKLRMIALGCIKSNATKMNVVLIEKDIDMVTYLIEKNEVTEAFLQEVRYLSYSINKKVVQILIKRKRDVTE